MTTPASEFAACAHLRISWRTESIPGNPPAMHGWWECDSGCGETFWPDKWHRRAMKQEHQRGLALGREQMQGCMKGKHRWVGSALGATHALTVIERLREACQSVVDGEYDCDCVENQDPRDGYTKVFKCAVCKCRTALTPEVEDA